MNNRNYAFSSIYFFPLMLCRFAVAQEHAEYANGASKKVEPPKVFLDKSARIVEYQLKRLSNAQLLMIEVATDPYIKGAGNPPSP